MRDSQRAKASNTPCPRWLTALQLTGLSSVWVMAGFLGWHSLTDLDIWFHLRVGKDLLAGAAWPHVNTYSFTQPDFTWLNHEWLFQIIAAWTGPDSALDPQNINGWNLLRLVLILILMATLLLGDGCLRALRQRQTTLRPTVSAFITLLSLFLIWTRFNLRPELISYILFVLFVRTAEAHYRRPTPTSVWRDQSLWRLFALIWLWAQCHGFAAIGPVLLIVLIVSRLFESGPRWPWRWQLAPLLVTLMALLLTPNLWRGLLYPIQALTHLSSDTADLSHTVSELVPLLRTANSLGLTLLIFQISLVWSFVFIVMSWRRVSLFRVAILVMTAAAAFASQRNLALYGLAFVLLHTGYRSTTTPLWWRHYWLAKLSRLRFKQFAAGLVPGLGVAVILGTVIWWVPEVVSDDFYLQEGLGRRFGGGTTPATYPWQAARAISDPESDHTFANLGAAAFLLGTTDARVWIDGRTEAYPAQQWADYLKLRQAGEGALAILNRDRVQAVVLALSSGSFRKLAADLLASPSWIVTAADGGGLLFVHLSEPMESDADSLLREAAGRLESQISRNATRTADNALAAAVLYELCEAKPEAKLALSNGLKLRADHPTLNHNLGTILLAEGDFSGALAHFETAFANNKRLAGSVLNAGVCLMRLRQPEAAAKKFRRSLAIDEKQLGSWMNLAMALRQIGQTEKAENALKKALALQPENARLQDLLNQWQRGR